MIQLGEDELICDLAEVYQVHDMRAYSCNHIATLAKGLRDNSRIKMKATGLGVDIERLLLAHLADSAAKIWWSKTKDAEKGRNQPKSFVRLLTEKIDESKKVKPFMSSTDFDKAWRELNGCS